MLPDQLAGRDTISRSDALISLRTHPISIPRYLPAHELEAVVSAIYELEDPHQRAALLLVCWRTGRAAGAGAVTWRRKRGPTMSLSDRGGWQRDQSAGLPDGWAEPRDVLIRASSNTRVGGRERIREVPFSPLAVASSPPVSSLTQSGVVRTR